jgi:hypothetical protein
MAPVEKQLPFRMQLLIINRLILAPICRTFQPDTPVRQQDAVLAASVPDYKYRNIEFMPHRVDRIPEN